MLCYNSDVFNFLSCLFVFWPFCEWTDWLTELWLQSCFEQLGAKTKKQNKKTQQQQKNNKKKTSIISLCPSFFENRKKSLYPA